MINDFYKKYYVDMEALMAFVTSTPKNERNTTTLITERYPSIEDGNGEMSEIEGFIGREITESKSTLNETTNNIRYDLVKQFLDILLHPIYIDTDENEVNSLETLLFGFNLSVETLKNAGIIKEINED